MNSIGAMRGNITGYRLKVTWASQPTLRRYRSGGDPRTVQIDDEMADLVQEMRPTGFAKAAGQSTKANVLRFAARGEIGGGPADKPIPGGKEGSWRTNRWPRLRRGLVLAGICAVMAVATAQVAEWSEWLDLPPTRALGAHELRPELLRVHRPSRLQPLSFVDPARLLREAGDCMVNASQVSACGPALMRALAANRRATQAAIWLAQIASFEGHEGAARTWYAFGYERDRSFVVLWAWANSGLSDEGIRHEKRSARPSTQPGRRELLHGEMLDRQLLLMAPPGFEAHFPVLIGKEQSAEDLYKQLSTEGGPAQTATLLRFLLRHGHSDGGRLVQRMLQTGRELPGLRGMPCAELARHVVTNALRASVTKAELVRRQAEDVWRAAVDGNPAICDAIESRLLPDKRLRRQQDPVWNFNAGLRLPMIPESFDWSVVSQAASQVRSQGTDGGLRVTLESMQDKSVVLLARPLPQTDRRAGSNQERTIQVYVRWRQPPPLDCATGWQWELRDRRGEKRFSHAPVWQVEPRSAGTMAEARYLLSLPEEIPFPQLLLRFTPPHDKRCGRQVLELERVEVFPMETETPGS